VRDPCSDEAPTGTTFGRQSAEAIAEAVARFENNSTAFTPEACRRNAERFSAGRFRRELAAALDAAIVANAG
jgi:hypothetical protein